MGVPSATSPASHEAESIDRLIRSDDDIALNKTIGQRHSKIVRWMRLVLPVVALGFIAIVMSFSGHESRVAPVPREKILPSSVSRNELINPKFQSEDDKSQPYTITADKAFQESSNMDLVILQQPVADVALKNGQWLAIKAKDGEFIQSTQQLHLKGDVRLFHDDGYELQTDKVDLDAAAQTAHTTSPVSGHGPAGTIHGQGLQADGKTGVLIFTGKSKLILNNSHIAPSGKRQP